MVIKPIPSVGLLIKDETIVVTEVWASLMQKYGMKVVRVRFEGIVDAFDLILNLQELGFHLRNFLD